MKGTIRKPRYANGGWSYRIDLGYDDSGQRRQQQVGGFRTRKEAEAAMSESLASLNRGTYVAPTRHTVRNFLETWIVTAKSELAITAWTNYSTVLDTYVLPYLGGKLLTDLSPIDIKKWHGELLDHGRKDGRPLAVNSVVGGHQDLPIRGHRGVPIHGHFVTQSDIGSGLTSVPWRSARKSLPDHERAEMVSVALF